MFLERLGTIWAIGSLISAIGWNMYVSYKIGLDDPYDRYDETNRGGTWAAPMWPLVVVIATLIYVVDTVPKRLGRRAKKRIELQQDREQEQRKLLAEVDKEL